MASVECRYWHQASIWAAGIDAEDLLDDEGRIDTAKATAAIGAAAEKLGLARPVGPRRAVPPGKPVDPPAPDRLVDAFRPPRRREDAAYR